MKKWAKVLSAAIIFAAASTVHAQQGGPPDNGGPGGGPGGGPDGGPPDPQEMQARMDQRIKSALAATDDTWATLQPLIDKVQQLEHETDAGPRMHGPPHREEDDNGPDGHEDDHPHSAVESAVSNLKKVLSDKSASDGKIQEAMTAVQDAEKKASDDLVTARQALKAAVDLRQQAVLVALGVLN